MTTFKGAIHPVLNPPQALENTIDVDPKSTLLYGILEGMMDGILVVSAQGHILYANQSAQDVCQLLLQTRSNRLPHQIWRTCAALIESRELFPQQHFILEDEIQTEQLSGLRVRVRWLEGELNSACLLVTIENRARNNMSLALAEAKRYGLTSRETEVWMLRRTNLTYKAIAAKLHIAIDTVKKHIKNIHAKQQVASWNDSP